MWAKICGNTTLRDALLAARLGANAVGFVFAPSRRQVTVEQVARITPHLPERVEKVGVFAASTADEIAAAVQDARLDTVQLHSAFDARLAYSLQHRFGGKIRIIQAVHWPVEAAAGTEAGIAAHLDAIRLEDAVERVLVDTGVGAATGGTGIPFDWAAAQGIFMRYSASSRMILAGGLNPGNVAEAIHRLQPWGVDVVSGVEESAGRKDPEKLARFLAIVKALRREPAPSTLSPETVV